MAWDNGTVDALRNAENQKPGRIGSQPLMGLIRAARDNQGQAEQPVPREVNVASAISTAVVAVTGAGRLYKVRIENLTTDTIFVVIADNVAAQTIAAGKCPPRISATVPSTCEVTLFEDPGVTGVAFATSLRVRAFIIDGTGTTTASAGVSVKLLVG